MSRWQRVWCRITGRHRGHVDYILDVGAFWMCSHCGEVVR